uniref:AlNc14C53G4128 protein n=1 Tax=Albugo laibachii Nc14 TaxID=890382 RepID=F0WBT7_9STRA|nr:AlNc14C53G4128 [Albugo laibachii Nc14]CCA20570.1 AlNc14C97G5930 [Albugo laibachii Nc14]|eukprot:CCA20570.1 AlNc14C97G5930 [Albugo laibachii Nc14]
MDQMGYLTVYWIRERLYEKCCNFLDFNRLSFIFSVLLVLQTVASSWLFTIDNIKIGGGSHEDQQVAYSEACADSMFTFVRRVRASNKAHPHEARSSTIPKLRAILYAEKQRQRTSKNGYR